ncbi:MAG: hypothetical protein R3D45_07110 [Rhizobiaceae bacterium]
MLAEYQELSTWLGIVFGGVAGCLAVAFLGMAKGAPFSAIGGNLGKQLWSVIYAIPVPLLLQAGAVIGLVLAFAWLVVSPIIGLKTVFKPQVRLRMSNLLIGHAVYAIAVLAVYFAVTAFAA